MKKNLLYLLVLLMSWQSVNAQDAVLPDTTIINKSWRDLKSALKSKTDGVVRLTRALGRDPNVDKKQLNTSAMYARDLSAYLDTLIHNDSVTINHLNELNNNLTEAFSRTLATLQTNPRFNTSSSYTRIVSQVAGIDSRIVYTKKTYNETCLQFNRSDLLFGNDEDDDSP